MSLEAQNIGALKYAKTLKTNFGTLMALVFIKHHTFFSFLLALQLNAGYGLLIHEVFLDHTQPTHHSR